MIYMFTPIINTPRTLQGTETSEVLNLTSISLTEKDFRCGKASEVRSKECFGKRNCIRFLFNAQSPQGCCIPCRSESRSA